ncbi:hypothetical protein ACLD0W_18015 [Alloalcanivorax sp. C16-1]|uniref:hypothetical protein n=1 Tax=Alloalcanivorax sp. C16-1 TaxID=3390051 RepID=UPI00397048A5
MAPARSVPAHRSPPLKWLALAILAASMCVLFALPRAGQAQALSIHVIQRADAQALVPVIRPLLPEGGYVNAYQGKLIIRTSTANFDEILAALGDMPEAPRTVAVHLRRRAGGESAGGGIRVGPGGVSAGAGSVTRQRQDDYRINTLSGHAAAIGQGTLVALTGTQYPALMSLRQGIEVRPMLTGDGRVRLDIAQRFERPAGGGTAEIQGAASTLMMVPGQWQPLGAITVTEDSSAAGLGGADRHSERLSLPLEVKVELQGD